MLRTAAQSTEPTDPAEYHLRVLLDAHERLLYGYLVRMLGDTDLAQDCAQETFIRAHRALQQGRTISRRWLFRVAHNCAVDELRRRNRTRADSEVGDLPVREHVDESLAVRETMDRLDPRDRSILELFVVEGFRTAEIGEMLGVRDAAVRQRLLRARERFRLLYGDAA